MIQGILYALYFSLATGVVGIFIFNDIPTKTAFLKSFSLGLLTYLVLGVSGVLTQYSNTTCGHEKYSIIL